MTRKDYVVVAEILSTVRDRAERQRLAEAFAKWFRRDNPAFDVERFSSAIFKEPEGKRSGSSRTPRRKRSSRPSR